MTTFLRRQALALAALALAAGALAPCARAETAVRITGEKQVNDRTVVLTVATSAFTAPTNVDVILPTGYDGDPGRRWPVTYVLAGTMNNYDSFRKVVKGVQLTAAYPSIIVSPDGNSGYWSDWYNGGAFGPPKYETFVIGELLPLIDARFRTIPHRSGRAILGISMGGYGSMMYAARHPDLFVAAATLSGAVDSNNPFLAGALSASSEFDGGAVDAINGPRATQEVRWHGRNPTDLAENLRDVDVQVRTANGTPDPGIGENPASADGVSCVVEGGVHMGSVSFHDKLTAIGKPHLWRDYGPGCHTVPNFEREILDTLAVFERVLAEHRPAPDHFDYRSIEPRFGLYGWRFAADPRRALEFMRVQEAPGTMTVTGSGRTSVVTPRAYRGLRLVDVNGTPTPVGRDGRLRFTLDLGPADTTQQYTPGAVTTPTARRAALAPHAVVRILRALRVRRGVRVCARALGGDVPGALIRVGARHRRVTLRARARCVTIAGAHGSGPVTIRGRDRFGHPVRARARTR